MFKKATLILLSALILFSSSLGLFAKTAHAQWYRQSYPTWVAVVEGNGNDLELYGERYAAAQVRWIIYGMVYAIFGDHPFFNCAILVMAGAAQGNSNPAEGVAACFLTFWNAIQATGDTTDANINQSPVNQLATTISTSPVSSVAYFKTIGNRLHLVPEAQAQGEGFGFEAAEVIFQIWEASRNVAYSLLIIVIIIMAFMIMFRVKLSPQTVITVQSALPKVIITLILITFSYAIAGLLIDLMYVVIGLLTTILLSSGLSDMENWGDLFAELTYRNGAFDLMGKYFVMFIGAFLWTLFSNVAGITAGVIAIIAPGGVAAGGVLLIVIFLIVAIMLLILAFRVAWMLIKNFVMLILSIAFGPFQILLGALGPGGFGPWAKNLIGLLAVYPVTGLMFVLSFIFLRGASASILPSDIWPFDVAEVVNNGTWTPPLTSGTSDLDLVWLGVSLAIIALIPKTADMIKGFMTGRPLAYGTGIGEGFAFATGAASSVAGMGGAAIQKAGVGAIKPHADALLQRFIKPPVQTGSSKLKPDEISN